MSVGWRGIGPRGWGVLECGIRRPCDVFKCVASPENSVGNGDNIFGQEVSGYDESAGRTI